MITNLFSIFDPSSSSLSLAWLILILISLILPSKLWNISAPTSNFNNIAINTIYAEISTIIGNNQSASKSLITSIFMTILLINFIALYPSVFSSTSHLTVNLPLSLLFWLAIIIFGWLNNTHHILTHLLPQGTPEPLIIFIVLIEITSNLIRPITLCVRLTANLIAGHLLISLLGNSLLTLPSHYSILVIPAPIMLTILESAVAIIQAYVFITLILLYSIEIN